MNISETHKCFGVNYIQCWWCKGNGPGGEGCCEWNGGGGMKTEGRSTLLREQQGRGSQGRSLQPQSTASARANEGRNGPWWSQTAGRARSHGMFLSGRKEFWFLVQIWEEVIGGFIHLGGNIWFIFLKNHPSYPVWKWCTDFLPLCIEIGGIFIFSS